jgi:glycosyltransferase involved in cell wall biosynthesis
MRILVVSNFYPPHFFGGYELGCRDVVERLLARGHDVNVLTSRYGVESGEAAAEPRVQRLLSLSLALPGRPADPPHSRFGDCAALFHALRRFSPQAIYFWNQSGLSPWLAEAARTAGIESVFFLSDTSFVSWRTGAFLRRWMLTQGGGAGLPHAMRAALSRTWLVQGRPVLRGQPCHFASRFLWDHARASGIAFAQELSLVAHWGIEPECFRFAEAAPLRWPPQRLLFAGQVIREKGVHTAIEALALLRRLPGFQAMQLTVAGGSSQPDYEREMHALAERSTAAGAVHFLGKVARENLRGIYHAHDVLIFPSIWEEPFAITPLEAMASGLPVAGTLTGGSAELFEDGVTAVTFTAGDAGDCARSLARLCSNRELFDSIRRRGAERIAVRHTLDHMVDCIENGLRRIVQN